jgi:hypothetical protein
MGFIQNAIEKRKKAMAEKQAAAQQAANAQQQADAAASTEQSQAASEASPNWRVTVPAQYAPPPVPSPVAPPAVPPAVPPVAPPVTPPAPAVPPAPQANTTPPAPTAAPAVPASAPASEMDAGLLAHLQQMGYTPERLEELNSYDPEKDGSVLSRIQSLMTPPPAVDERALQRRSTIAGIGDSLRMLAQMYAAGQGAYISPHGKDWSVTGKELARGDKKLDRYEALLEKYGQQQYDARVRAFLKEMDNRQTERGNLQKAVSDYHKKQQDAQKQEKELDYRRGRDAGRLGQQQAEAQEKERHNRSMEGASWSRANSTIERNRVLNSRTASGGKSSGAGKDDVILLTAASGDPHAETRNGESVVAYRPQPGERDRAYAAGMDRIRSKAYRPETHPGLFEEKLDSWGNVVGYVSVKDRKLIESAVFQELYDGQFLKSAIPEAGTVEDDAYDEDEDYNEDDFER